MDQYEEANNNQYSESVQREAQRIALRLGHIEYTTCDHCDIVNNVQRACCPLIICIFFQNGNEKLKGIHQEFKQVYLGQMIISLLRLPSVEQEGIFTALSVHMGGSSKIYSNCSGLMGCRMETVWST